MSQNRSCAAIKNGFSDLISSKSNVDMMFEDFDLIFWG
jgi:hypothetical protein